MEQEIKKPWCELGQHKSYKLYAHFDGKIACNACYQRYRTNYLQKNDKEYVERKREKANRRYRETAWRKRIENKGSRMGKGVRGDVQELGLPGSEEADGVPRQ